MRCLLLCLLFLSGWATPRLVAQNEAFPLAIQPVYRGEKVALAQAWRAPSGDSLVLHTLRFYAGNFVFFKKGRIVWEDKKHRLLDLELENPLRPVFVFPLRADFDSLAFDLGVDSLTTASGAMGGDLDPTKGMFWTWQSGYINVKIEGVSSKCHNRGGGFEFHLGGYLPPFSSLQRVGLRYRVGEAGGLLLDLTPFFDEADRQGKTGVMSPGASAVRLSGILAQSFNVYEK